MAKAQRKEEPGDDILDRALKKIDELKPGGQVLPRNRGGRVKRMLERGEERQRKAEAAKGPPITPERPALFTPRSQERFFRAVRVGNRLTAACRFAGLPTRVVKDWLERGTIEADGFYRWFFEQYEAALGTAEINMQARILAAAQSDHKYWRAAAFLLTQRFPQGWPGTSGSVSARMRGGGRVPAPGGQSSAPEIPRVTGDPLANVPMDALMSVGFEVELNSSGGDLLFGDEDE